VTFSRLRRPIQSAGCCTVALGNHADVGHNSNAENFDRLLALGPDGSLRRTRSSFINDNREFFVKVSYLLRF
jgi:hypothetical protein